MAAQASPLPDSIQRFQHPDGALTREGILTCENGQAAAPGPPQFPKTHSLAARWNSAGLNPRVTGHALARGLSAWRPDSRSLHTTDLLHRLYGSSSDWKQHIAFALVITFRMKWARSSNLRRMISLDRNPGFAERNRLSAKASRLRRRAIGFAPRAAAAPPRACSLRCRSKFGPAGSSASTAPGSARVPRGESAIGLCSRRSGLAWRWPCFNWVWPTRS